LPTLSRSALLLPICLLVALSPAPSSAYVPSTTKETGTRLRWTKSNCVYLRTNARGSDNIKDGSDVAAVKKAIKNWADAIRTCSYLKFLVLEDKDDAKPSFTRNGCNENVVYWVEAGWKSNRKFDPMAAAITTVFFVEKKGDSRDGRILDADMELNGEFFTWSSNGGAGKTDIDNTVTHELGHVMGLDHPCYDPNSTLPRPKDSEGNAVPDCSTVIGSSKPEYLTIRDSTMYNFAEPGETKKRSPEADDIKGICNFYPTASDPGTCEQVCYGAGEEGCSVASSASSEDLRDLPLSLVLLALMAGLILAVRRAGDRR
jgi:hypothetical protein